jgi:preprotein translocase subunit SecA
LFRFEMMTRPMPTIEQLLSIFHLEKNRSFMPDIEAKPAPAPEPEPESEPERNREEERLQPVIAGPKTGRNDLCPCGSGKKYKKCCGLNKDEE